MYIILHVFTINVFVYDSQSISGLNYECVVAGSSTAIIIPATRVSDTTVVCNIGQGNEVSSIDWVTLVTRYQLIVYSATEQYGY